MGKELKITVHICIYVPNPDDVNISAITSFKSNMQFFCDGTLLHVVLIVAPCIFVESLQFINQRMHI